MVQPAQEVLQVILAVLEMLEILVITGLVASVVQEARLGVQVVPVGMQDLILLRPLQELLLALGGLVGLDLQPEQQGLQAVQLQVLV